MEKKRKLSQYINYIKRKKEAKLAIFYSVFYFIFITLLLVFGTTVRAQTPGILIKAANPKHEMLMRPVESMMARIYNLKMTGDFEKDYVAIMHEFQEGGKGLCAIYKMSGEDPELLENAEVSQIELKDYQKQINPFKPRNTAFTPIEKTASYAPEPNDLMETLNKMMSEMKRKYRSDELNNDFAAIMVLYDWAGAELAKAELRYGMNSQLKEKSKEMVEDFSANENQLMNWFNKYSTANR